MDIHPGNLESGELFGLFHRFKLFAGAHYIGGYIGDNEYKHDWMKKRTETWKRNIGAINKNCR